MTHGLFGSARHAVELDMDLRHSEILRDAFAGPERLSPAWKLRRGRVHARCDIWSHVQGFELRLSAGNRERRAVCVSHDDLVDRCVEWRRELLEQGWRQQK